MLDPHFTQLYTAAYRELVLDKERRPLCVSHEKYLKLADFGVLHCMTARTPTRLVGYALFLKSPTLWYGPAWVPAICDAWFIDRHWRRGYTGIKFLKSQIEYLRKLDCSIVYYASQAHKSLDKLYQSQGLIKHETRWQMLLK